MRSLRATLIAALVTCAFAPAAMAQQPLQARGKTVFDHWCHACHKRLYRGDLPVAGTSSLQRKYHGTKAAALEDRTDLSAGQIRYLVRHGIKSMPGSRKTEISDADLDALAAYLTRNAAAR
ncbi:MAG TPA: cytochrome c [Steroidobacteraceae bacterium]|nr:cytochrome c [Steroidobacteraceae bacterium]